MCKTTNTPATIHVFEQAGLGLAPFRYLGMKGQEIAYGQAVIGHAGGCAITTKPGGTCDYCGTYIVNMFRVGSADGKEFIVGCDCIMKVDGAGSRVANLTQLEIDVKNHKREVKQRGEAVQIAAARAALDSGACSDQPHPIAYHADNGLTLADYCRWLLDNAGRSGQMRACRMIAAPQAVKGSA